MLSLPSLFLNLLSSESSLDELGGDGEDEYLQCFFFLSFFFFFFFLVLGRCRFLHFFIFLFFFFFFFCFQVDVDSSTFLIVFLVRDFFLYQCFYRPKIYCSSQVFFFQGVLSEFFQLWVKPICSLVPGHYLAS